MTLGVGNDNKLYYNSATAASPTWVLICIVGNVSVDINIGNAEVDLRCSNWLLGLPSKLSGGFNFTLATHPGNTVFDALRGIALARTPKQFASADGLIATSGTQAFKGFAHFTAFPLNQETQSLKTGDATLGLSYVEEPAGTLIEPSWVTIA